MLFLFESYQICNDKINFFRLVSSFIYILSIYFIIYYIYLLVVILIKNKYSIW